MTRPRAAVRAGIGLVLVLAVAAACQPGAGTTRPAGQATSTRATGATGFCVRNEQGSACLPVAPEGDRVDRARPSFTDPTRITNPRFPVAGLTQVLQLGHEGGKPLRVEVTRLPRPRTIEWDGRRVGTVASQFVAYLDGRIQRWRSTTSPRPTMAQSGTSARTWPTTGTAPWPTTTAVGWRAGTAPRG